MGLIDTTKLKVVGAVPSSVEEYYGNRSGLNGQWSAPSWGGVGGKSALNRGDENDTDLCVDGACDEVGTKCEQNSALEEVRR